MRRNTMSNKKKSKKQFPFNNEINILKETFKKSIDDMPDRDFIDLLSFIMFASEDFEDEDWTFDEEWEDEANNFYNQGKKNSNNKKTIIDDNLPF